ncbi:DUF2264 domain-containing protein [Pedobacter borealis]|uniref:DUF2264 domain-containing protein n=1 Tax=Pedobacter borealis TaxID=475254 RepID=UPI0004931799|nr:DUF2264 domain-containing protein [Pedobacter borealis]
MIYSIKIKLSSLSLLMSFFLAFTTGVDAQMKTNEMRIETTDAGNGKRDREYWSQLLYKMSYPVIHNLANETLRKNMPLETLPDYGKAYGMVASEVSYLEAVGRTMAGVAPWLALPDDNTKEGVMRKQLRTELLQGIAHGVDPNSKDYLNFSKQQQPLVDAAFMAHAFIRAPKALWEPLDALTKKRVIQEFKSLRNRKATFNNWLLFSGITEGFLLKVGADYDPVRIDYAIRKTTEWYSGDGWYSDGSKLCVDYYNSFVMHPMMVDLLGIVTAKKMYPQEDYDLAVKRMGRYSEFLERMIAPDGTFPVFGRSMTYRTGAFQALAQTALMEKLNNITPAQVRCGLTAVMNRMYDQCDNFDNKGWLVLGFCGSQPDIADLYTSTGSLYMATLAFLPLGLPADNPFWTDAPADWTSKKAWSGKQTPKDYKVSY